MRLLAHKTKIDDQFIEQSLEDHCRRTADYAAESVRGIGFEKIAYLAGILHDMGKACETFQQYLDASCRGEDVRRGSVIHTFTPVVYILEKYHGDNRDVVGLLTSEVLAYADGAHHGLFDCVDLDGNSGFQHRLRKERMEISYDEACTKYFSQVIGEAGVDELWKNARLEIANFYEDIKSVYRTNGKCFFQISMLVRLLTSAVIYGDRRDTREFMSQRQISVEQTVDWKKQLDFLEEKLCQMDVKTPLNQVRRDISQQCAAFAEHPTGIYRLNVPTGAGKTLATLRYALAHAYKYKKKKIIFISPLLSILDQNAKVIRSHLADEELILEHHSNVVREKNQGDELDNYEVLAENWDAPIIISTMYQFLTILFDQSTAAIGRMRALCDSVIVIDEVQSVPKKSIEMFCMAMNFLNRYCHATILLSSATQPCFENLKFALDLSTPADLVQLSKEQKQVFHRANVINCMTKNGMSMDECVGFCTERMTDNRSVLVICNTKSEARNLFLRMQRIAEENGWLIYHLSTAMCQRHRMTVLDEVQTNLCKPDKRVLCIATQLVEAGVDFSFQAVVRVLAGIDNLVQAVGRCNRSNEYDGLGNVYLINLKDENLSMLQEIYLAQTSTRQVLQGRKVNSEKMNAGNIDLDDQKAFLFYQCFFDELGENLKFPIPFQDKPLYLADLLANRVPDGAGCDSYALHQPFKIIAQNFQVLDKKNKDVIVPYKEGEALIEKLRKLSLDIKNGYKNFNMKLLQNILQETRRFTISIFDEQMKCLYEQGCLESLFDGRIFVLRKQAYHADYGLRTDHEPKVEDYMI